MATIIDSYTAFPVAAGGGGGVETVLPSSFSTTAGTGFRFTPTAVSQSSPVVTEIDEAYGSYDQYGIHGAINTAFLIDFADDSLGAGTVSEITVYVNCAHTDANSHRFDVEVLKAGSPLATENITTAPSDNSAPIGVGLFTLTNASWVSTWTETERNSMQVRVTYAAQGATFKQMFIGTVNVKWDTT